MPYRPLRPCAYPGCPELTRETRYCPGHAHLAPPARGPDLRVSASRRGYGARWRAIRAYVLRTEPLCRRCSAAGNARLAAVVHHKDRDQRNNQPDNLEPLCNPCHEAEHASERAEGRGASISGANRPGTGGGASRARSQNSTKGYPDGRG